MSAGGIGSTTPGAARPSVRSFSKRAPAGALPVRTPSTCRPGVAGPWAQRSSRSASASSTTAPLSFSAKAMSSACQCAFIATAMAPTDTAATKENTHSG